MSDWVQKYFDCGVGFDLARIENDDKRYPDPLQELLSRFIMLSRSEEGPCALPIVNAEKQVELLISATTPEQSAELQSIAHAYLGSVYAFVESALVSTASDAACALILAHRPGGIVRIRILKQQEKPAQYQKRVYTAMNLVLEFIEQYQCRPLMLTNIRRPTGRVLRDLFITLRDENAQCSWQYFEELRDAQALSARNMLFLELQINAALGDWTAIVDHPRIGDVISGRVPRQVAMVFLAALEALMLRFDVLQAKGLDEVRGRLSSASAFFTREPDLEEGESSIAAWRTWATGAALIGNYDGATNVRERMGEEWFGELRELFGFAIEDEPLRAPEDDPVDGLLLSPETYETAIELLKCTLQGNDKQCRRIADRLRTYPSEIIDGLRKNGAIRMLWDGVVGKNDQKQPIKGWSEWFDRAQAEPESEFLLQAVMEGVAYWGISTWDEGALMRLAGNANVSGTGIVRNVLPMLLSWIEEHEVSLSTSCAELLLLDLALDDIASVQDLSLTRDLLTMVIAKPHDCKTYDTMLDAVEEIWQKVKSIHGLPGMFDVFDLLLDGPCSDESRRQNLWQCLQKFLLSSWQRLDLESRVLAKGLSEELLGSSSQFSFMQGGMVDEAPSENIVLCGKKLAIYTLMEKAAQRAKTALEQLYPGLTVVLNHDHTATGSLVHLIQSADYFIFAARCAKHQAFYPVTKSRDDIIYPDGKGAMSLIRAFSEALREY